jgi:hypothetical protein
MYQSTVFPVTDNTARLQMLVSTYVAFEMAPQTDWFQRWACNMNSVALVLLHTAVTKAVGQCWLRVLSFTQWPLIMRTAQSCVFDLSGIKYVKCAEELVQLPRRLPPIGVHYTHHTPTSTCHNAQSADTIKNNTLYTTKLDSWLTNYLRFCGNCKGKHWRYRHCGTTTSCAHVTENRYMQQYKLQDLVLVIQMHFQFDQKLTFLKFSTLAAEGPVYTPSSLKSWHVQAGL